MFFSIRFFDEPNFVEESAAPSAHGLITIGNFKEGFYSSLLHWSRAQYEDQWSNAVRDLLNGSVRSALITNFLRPDAASNLEWWPMFREGEIVYLQNHLLFFDQLESPFSPASPVASLRDRETLNENGYPISEWSIPVNHLTQFLESLTDL